MACKNFILGSCNIIHLVIVLIIIMLSNWNGYTLSLSLAIGFWDQSTL